MLFTPDLAKIISKRYYQHYVMKSLELLLLNSQLHSYSAKETKYLRESNIYYQKEPLILI